MNIIDLDQALIVDPRPFLKKFYKKGKPAKDIAWDDYAAWNVLIEQALEYGCYFYNNYSFHYKRNSPDFKTLNQVDLLDKNNNIVLSVNPKNSVWFEKDGATYVAFGPFVVKHSWMPLLNVPMESDVEEPVTVVKEEVDPLEYLDEVGAV